SALAAEGQGERMLVDPHVALQQRCNPAPAFVSRIGLMAGSEIGDIDKPRGGGESHGGRAWRDVLGDCRAQPRQGLSKLDEAIGFRHCADIVPCRVIDVLQPPGLIAADRLEVSLFVTRNPDVSPGWRNDERLDAFEMDTVDRPRAPRVAETNAIAVLYPRNRQLVRRDAAKF